jgi:hypothetical protein
MDYGGWKRGGCGRSCDGMPVSSDPGWTLATDDHGCKVWQNANDRFRGGTYNPDTSYCGGRHEPLEAGTEAGDE